MTALDVVLILLAGTAAGAINAAVGSGSLITFPTLLALGFPPVLANVSNNIGLVPGGVASVWGYRRELADQRRRLLVLGSMSVLGGAAGAVLLLVLPASAFRAVVPVLIGVAVLLVAVQPWIARALARRPGRSDRPDVGPAALVATAACGVYGGYFGGAQGILLVGLLGTVMTETLQRLNALKNGLVTCVNAVAAGTFLVVAPDQVDWRIVGLIAVGSSAGGLLGSRIGRRLPQSVLRAVIVVVGLVAIVNLLRPA
ncbi:sulfite exporter TauE/SafE family protein [Pseudonocardia petroleophila]|uniref:Probable membrane transporter protein n=1 Tax=Pseudonocardia petroleophila TaxID=37331 RepID=A0A7G7MPB1_9PSEU|nr:sulfite exporter TauE/SafE family protein [Pseudonocardia petroleophila]QNG54622.1 sulfite exporter TauE/SafE family protein [Pseudonocardia petroleophila]